MNKQAYDIGFIKACSQYGITDKNQIEMLYKQSSDNWFDNIMNSENVNSIMSNPYYSGLAGAGLGAGMGALMSSNDRFGGALAGAGIGGGLGMGAHYAPEILNYLNKSFLTRDKSNLGNYTSPVKKVPTK